MTGSRLFLPIVNFNSAARHHPWRNSLVLTTALVTAFGVLPLSKAWGADVYPQRAIRLIVPFPPGGGLDIIARILAPRLGEALGQSVVVDSRAGGNTIIGTELAAKAEPNGYTLLLANSQFVINAGLVSKLPYDVIKDFSPVILIADAPLIFAAHPSLKASGMQELVAQAKARPGQINYGSAGSGSPGHLSVELLKWITGIQMAQVPYKGAAPMLADLIGGQIQVTCTSLLPTLPHIKAGRLVALGVTSRSRSRIAPDIPAVSESIPGYDSTIWYAMMAPAGTPQAIINKLQIETSRILKMPQVTDQFLAQGADPVGSTPQEFGKFLKAELERWTKLIRQAKIVAN